MNRWKWMKWSVAHWSVMTCTIKMRTLNEMKAITTNCLCCVLFLCAFYAVSSSYRFLCHVFYCFFSLLPYIYHNCRNIRRISVCVCLKRLWKMCLTSTFFFSWIHSFRVCVFTWSLFQYVLPLVFQLKKRKLRTRFIINDVDRRFLMQQLLPINNSVTCFRIILDTLLSQFTFFLLCDATCFRYWHSRIISYHIISYRMSFCWTSKTIANAKLPEKKK